MVLRVLLQQSSRLRGSEGSVLSMKVIETSFKNPLRPGLEKCLKRCSCIHVAYIDIFCCYLYSCSIEIGNLLQFDLRIVPSIVCKLINKTFAITIKFMVCFLCLMGHQRHTAQRFPSHFHEPVTLSRGYNLSFTK